MKAEQRIARRVSELNACIDTLRQVQPGLVLVFGGLEYFTPETATALQSAFAPAVVLGCSTAGEISTDGVDDGTCVLTALRFDQTTLRTASTLLSGMDDSQSAGERIGAALVGDGLRAILVFGPGVQINGSALVEGIVARVGPQIPITGGLAGDGGAFARTLTLGAEGVSDQAVVAVGLYGTALQFGHGSFGGWEPFGPARKVTKAVGNVLYELDNEPALEVYKRYLGDHAKGLPASGLLFPFAMLCENQGQIGLIRTILGVDEASGSLTLAGEIDPDGFLKLMHASTDKLVNGAEAAAEAAAAMSSTQGDGLAILVSCVGRKLVMGNRVDEEVEAVGEVFGRSALLTGFYSYGEISPFTLDGSCKLHNQTMTITWLAEK